MISGHHYARETPGEPCGWRSRTLWMAWAALLAASVALLVDILLFGRMPLAQVVLGWLGSRALVIVSLSVGFWWLAYAYLLERRHVAFGLRFALLPALPILLTASVPVLLLYLSDDANHYLHFWVVRQDPIRMAAILLFAPLAAVLLQSLEMARAEGRPSLRAMLTSRQGEIVALAVLLGLGLVVRMWFLPERGVAGDMNNFLRWAEGAITAPLDLFYREGGWNCEYLPGYIYVLAATAPVRIALTGSIGTLDQFTLLIKLAPMAADLILAATVFRLCRRHLSPERSLVAAALVRSTLRWCSYPWCGGRWTLWA